MGPDNRPRLADPGDPVMTRQDLLDYERMNRQAIQQDTANMRRKKLRKEMQEDPATGKMITSTIVALSRMKEGPVKARLFEGFWEHHWRPYEQAHTGFDPGPAPKSKTLRDKAIGAWNSIFGGNDLPEAEFKPGRASGPPAQRKMSPEDEVKQFEELIGAEP